MRHLALASRLLCPVCWTTVVFFSRVCSATFAAASRATGRGRWAWRRALPRDTIPGSRDWRRRPCTARWCSRGSAVPRRWCDTRDLPSTSAGTSPRPAPATGTTRWSCDAQLEPRMIIRVPPLQLIQRTPSWQNMSLQLTWTPSMPMNSRTAENVCSKDYCVLRSLFRRPLCVLDMSAPVECVFFSRRAHHEAKSCQDELRCSGLVATEWLNWTLSYDLSLGKEPLIACSVWEPFSLSFTVNLTETIFKAWLINDVIDDLILHAWKGQFDSLIRPTLFCVLSWSWSWRLVSC